MPDLSAAIALSRIIAVQRDTGVRVCRGGSVVAWSRCHLLGHWLQDLLPSACRIVGRAELGASAGSLAAGWIEVGCIVHPLGEVVLSMRPVSVSANGPASDIERLRAGLRGLWRQPARTVTVLVSLHGLRLRCDG